MIVRRPLHDLLESLEAKDLRSLLTELLMDTSQAALRLGVSESRVYQYTRGDPKLLTPVFGSSIFKKNDVEGLVEVLKQRRLRHGSGKNRRWVFSQENVLTTLISLFKNAKTDVELREIVRIFETNHEMEYGDIAARISFMLKKLMDLGVVKRTGRGLYIPLQPDKPVKEQLIVTKDEFPLDYGPFESDAILDQMKRMGGSAKVSDLVDALITTDYSKADAIKRVRGSLRKLLSRGFVERVSFGIYRVREVLK